jgi:hypothetical protein
MKGPRKKTPSDCAGPASSHAEPVGENSGPTNNTRDGLPVYLGLD